MAKEPADMNTHELSHAYFEGRFDLIRFVQYARIHIRKHVPKLADRKIDKAIVDIIRRFPR